MKSLAENHNLSLHRKRSVQVGTQLATAKLVGAGHDVVEEAVSRQQVSREPPSQHPSHVQTCPVNGGMFISIPRVPTPCVCVLHGSL